MNYYDRIVAIEKSDYQVTDIDIQTLENEYNVKLPEDYKKFLLKYNGGCTNKVTYINDNNCKKLHMFESNFWDIERFYEINSQESYWDLRERVNGLLLDMKYSEKPEWTLWAIAQSTSRTFAISLNDNENYGAIYFVDTMVIEEELSYTKVEVSFTDFMRNIIPDEIIEQPEVTKNRIIEIYRDNENKMNHMLESEKRHEKTILERKFIPIKI